MTVKIVRTGAETRENYAQTCENKLFLVVNCHENGALRLGDDSCLSFINICNTLCVRLIVNYINMSLQTADRCQLVFQVPMPFAITSHGVFNHLFINVLCMKRRAWVEMLGTFIFNCRTVICRKSADGSHNLSFSLV